MIRFATFIVGLFALQLVQSYSEPIEVGIIDGTNIFISPPEDFTEIGTVDQNKVFVSMDLYSFDEGIEFCKNNGGILLEPKTKAVNEFVKDYLLKNDYKGNLWMGGARRDDAKNFKWLSENSFIGASGYVDWNPGEPTNNVGSDAFCMEFTGNFMFRWSDIICAKKQYVLCQSTATTPAPTKVTSSPVTVTPPDQIGNVDDTDISISREQYTYDEAIKYCKARGSSLLEPRTKEMNEFVRDYFIKYGYNNKGNAWQAGTRRENPVGAEYFYWPSDKSNIADGVAYWYPGQPNEGQDPPQECIEFRGEYDWHWNDCNCIKKNFALCGTPVSTTTTLSPAIDVGEVEGTGVTISQEQCTYDEAIAYCQARGSSLLEPRTKEMSEFVREYLIKNDYNKKGNVWQAGTRRGNPVGAEYFYWPSDKSAIANEFTYWYQGQPNEGQDPPQECIEFRGEYDWHWNDWNCNKKNFALCGTRISVTETPAPFTTIAPVTPSPPIHVGNKDDTSVMISQEQYTYDEAVAYCKARGTTLLEPRTKEMNEFIREYLLKNGYNNKGNAWQAGTRRGNSVGAKYFYWPSDKSTIANGYTYWYPGQPNEGQDPPQECIEFRGEYDWHWNDWNCNKKNFALCGNKLPVKPPIDAGEVDGTGILVSQERYTFDEAIEYCKTHKATLVEPRTKAVNDHVRNYLKNDYKRKGYQAWMGGTRLRNAPGATNFYWLSDKYQVGSVDGRGYKDWQAGEPNNQGGIEECMEFRSYFDFHWNDMDCTNERIAVCQYDLPAKPPIDLGYVDDTGVFISQEKYNFDEAINYCKARNAFLLEPRTNPLNEFVRAYLLKNGYESKGSAWFGGTRKGNKPGSNAFYWLTDKSVVDTKNGFPDWGSGEPNNAGGDEECMEFRASNQFHRNDLKCQNKQYVLCGYEVPKTPSIDIGSEDGTSVQISQEKYTFDGAVKYCNLRGGYLIEPRTKAINELIRIFLIENGYDKKGNAWMGGTRRGKTSSAKNFYWLADKQTVGSTDGFVDWYPGEPNNCGGKEECIEFRSSLEYHWKDIDCSISQFAICGFDLPPKPAIDVGSVDGIEIIVSQEKYNFDEAAKYCQANGGELIEPNTKATNEFVRNYLLEHGYKNKGSVWTGGNRRGNPHGVDAFYWNSNTSPRGGCGFTDWYPGKPNNEDSPQECIEMRNELDFHWNDWNCQNKLFAMCGKKLPPKPEVDIGTEDHTDVKISQEKYTFDEAIEYCKQKGGALVEPRTKTMNDMIKDYLGKNDYKSKGNAWLGGSRRGLESNLKNFYWLSDKSTFVSQGFNDFASDEPNNVGGKEECVEFRGQKDFQWNDIVCSYKQFAICGVKKEDKPTDIGTVDNLGFQISREMYNYDEAIAYCKKNRGTLVEPRTKSVNEFIKAYLSKSGYNDQLIGVWTGGNRRGYPADVKYYKWLSDKSTVGANGYSDWNSGEPNNGGGVEECLLFRPQSNFNWNDLKCSLKQYAVCQYELPKMPAIDMGTIDNTDYKISQEKYTLDEAVDYCHANGGYVIEPRTKTINEFVIDFLLKNNYKDKGNVFMGGVRRGNPPGAEYFYWLSSRATVGYSDGYTDWAVGEPNNKGGNSLCMQFRGSYFFHWDDMQCDVKQYVICGYDRPAKPPVDVGSVGSKDIKISQEKYNYDQAINYCKSHGASLLEPRTNETNEFVRCHLLKNDYNSRGSVWFGLTRHGYPHDVNNFYWLSDNSKVVSTGYSDWSSGEPNNYGGKEECVEYRASADLHWNDLNCDVKQFVLCASPSPVKPPIDLGTVDYQNLQISQDLFNYNEAIDYCKAKGGNLVEPRTKSVNDFIEAFLILKNENKQLGNVWMGGNRIGSPPAIKNLKWLSDGSVVGESDLFSNWGPGEPNRNNMEECMEFKKDHDLGWKCASCSIKQIALCSFSIPQRPEIELGSVDNSEVFISQEKYDFSQAVEYCSERAGKLLEPRTKEINDFVRDYLQKKEYQSKGDAWFGGTRTSKPHGTKNFYWLSDLTAVGYSDGFLDWSSGKPSNSGGNDECMVVRAGLEYRWSDLNCRHEQYVLCTRPLPPKPVIYIGSVGLTGVLMSQEKYSYDDAISYCIDQDADLLEPRNMALNDFARDYLNKNGFKDRGSAWFGASRRGHPFDVKNFHWQTDSLPLASTGFTDWSSGAHSNTNGNDECMVFRADKDYHWSDLNCEQKQFVMCGYTILPKPQIHVGTADGVDVKISQEKYTFDQAFDYCNSNGGILVEPRSQAINDVVKNYLHRPGREIASAWMGATRRGFQGVGNLYWLSDKTAVERSNAFTDWNSHEPNNKDGQENCIEFSSLDEYHWKDFRCDTQQYAVCQYQRTLEPAIDIGSVDGTGVLISKETHNYAEAVNYCKAQGASILEPRTKSLNDFVRNYLLKHGYKSKTNVWVGGTRRGYPYPVKSFYWMSDKSLVGVSDGFTDWNVGEPNNLSGKEECMELRGVFDYRWNDIECSVKLFVVCGYDLPQKPAVDVGTESNTKVKISQEKYTYDEAITFCEARDGVLLEPRTKALNELVRKFLISKSYKDRGSAWFGANKRGFSPENNFSWLSDKSTLVSNNFNDWSKGKPSKYGDNDVCVDFSAQLDFHWNDLDCSFKQFALCGFAVTSPDIEIGPTDGQDVSISSNKYTYDEAVQYCRAQGGNLVEPMTGNINYVIQNYLIANGYTTKGDAWMGGTRKGKPNEVDDFYWQSTKETVGSNGFNDWSINEPNNSGGKDECIAFRGVVNFHWDDLECANKLFAICGKSIPTTLSPTTIIQTTQSPDIVGKQIDTDVVISPDKYTFDEAILYCKNRGGFLLSAKTKDINNMVKNYLQSKGIKSDVWLSASKRGIPVNGRKSFYWIKDNRLLVDSGYHDWPSFEPNNFHGNEECVEYRREYNFMWNDRDCSTKSLALCEIPRPETTTPEPTIIPTTPQPTLPSANTFGTVGGNDLIISVDKYTYDQGIQFCSAYGGVPVEPRTKKINYFIKDYLVNNGYVNKISVWFGADRRGNSMNSRNSFLWYTDKTIVGSNGFNDWPEFEPNNYGGNEQCAEFKPQYNFKWNDINCLNKNYMICQVSTGSTTALPATTVSPADHVTADDTKDVYISQGKYNFDEAGSYCAAIGGTRLTVTSKKLNDDIKRYLLINGFLDKGGAWIGATREGNSLPNKESYYWLKDKSKVGSSNDLTDWHYTQPDNYRGNEECLAHSHTFSFFWNDNDCSRKLYVLCEIAFPVTSPIPTAPTESSPSLTTVSPTSEPVTGPTTMAEPQTYIGTLDEKDVYISRDRFTYDEANNFCKSFGGTMIAVQTKELNSYIKNFLLNKGYIQKGSVWLGANGRGFSSRQSNYYWTYDKMGVLENGFHDWHPSQPDNFLGREKCLEYSSYFSYMWNDNICTKKNFALCQVLVPTTIAPTEPSSTELITFPPTTIGPFDGKPVIADEETDVYISSNKFDFDEAHKYCNTHGGAMITVKTKALDDGIKKYLSDNGYAKTGHVWLGADRPGLSLDPENFWWVEDKTPVGADNEYTAWGPGQPDNTGGKEECLQYSSLYSFAWNDIPCSNTYFVLCQFHKPTPPAPVTTPKPFDGTLVTPDGDNDAYISKDLFSFDEGDAYCKANGGIMIAVKTITLNNAIKKYLLDSGEKGNAWMGATRRPNKISRRDYYWVADKTIIGSNGFHDWHPIEPNNAGNKEECIEFHVAYKFLWNDGDCSLKQRVICSIPRVPTVAPPTTTSAPITGDHVTTTTETEVYITKEKLDFDEANSYCSAFGGALLTIKTKELNDVIKDYLNKYGYSGKRVNVWMGATRRGNHVNRRESFYWIVYGEPVGASGFQDWADNEPNNFANKEECLELSDGYKFRWNDRDCKVKQWALCEFPRRFPTVMPTIPPPKMSEYVDTVGELDIQISTSIYDFDEAAIFCDALGGILLAVKNKAISEAVTKYLNDNEYIRKGNVWIDGTRRGYSHNAEVYYWASDRSPVSGFLNWGLHQPDNYRNKEECMEISPIMNYKWNDNDCSTKQYVLCQVVAQPTTIKPADQLDTFLSSRTKLKFCAALANFETSSGETVVVNSSQVKSFKKCLQVFNLMRQFSEWEEKGMVVEQDGKISLPCLSDLSPESVRQLQESADDGVSETKYFPTYISSVKEITLPQSNDVYMDSMYNHNSFNEGQGYSVKLDPAHPLFTDETVLPSKLTEIQHAYLKEPGENDII